MSEELMGFLNYLTSLWGLLSSVTVFFPFSNHFIEIIPLLLEKTQATFLASLISTFMLFLLYTLRHKISSLKELSSLLAFSSFSLAVLLLWDYLKWMEPFSEYVIWTSGALLYTFEYGIIFGLFTTSFTILALIEYNQAEPPNQ